MTIWNSIHTNFQTFMEDSATGINSLTSITTNFAEYDDVDINSGAGSTFNGMYSIQLESINNVDQDLGTGKVDFSYNVKLQVGFESGQTKTEYNNIIEDIEEIIRYRLDDSTWSDPILTIEFINTNRIQFIDRPETERFGIVEMLFRITGRTNLSS